MAVKNTKKFTDIETLVKKNDICYEDRWHPIAISNFETVLSYGLLSEMDKNLRKNIAYSLQYLQYIQLQLEELTIHSVITTMLYKSFIITGVSIIEGLFYHLLKTNNLWKQREWELERIIPSNSFNFYGEDKKIETYLYRKVMKVDDEMNLDSMIKKIESKNLLDISHKAFPYIKKLKRLRNKVHLQIKEHPDDTDWWSYSRIDYLWMKYILYIILTNSKFQVRSDQKDIYNFISCNNHDIEILRKDVTKKAEKNESINSTE